VTERVPSSQARPLIGRGGLWALMTGTAVLFLVLLPFAQGRLHKAVEFAPSSLSIRYLKLGVDQRPDDLTLRMTLADKLAEVGDLDEARRHLHVLST